MATNSDVVLFSSIRGLGFGFGFGLGFGFGGDFDLTLALVVSAEASAELFTCIQLAMRSEVFLVKPTQVAGFRLEGWE